MLRAAVRGAHTAFLLVQLRGVGEDRRLFIFLLLTVRFGGKRGDTYEMAGRKWSTFEMAGRKARDDE